jgi:hypothetical protein
VSGAGLGGSDDVMFENRFSLGKSPSCTTQIRNKLLICLQSALIPLIEMDALRAMRNDIMNFRNSAARSQFGGDQWFRRLNRNEQGE